MTINAMDSSISAALTMNVGTGASASTASELTAAEKMYDLNNDGVLSATEKAAMLEASKNSNSSDTKSDSVSISKEALKMQPEKLAGN